MTTHRTALLLAAAALTAFSPLAHAQKAQAVPGGQPAQAAPGALPVTEVLNEQLTINFPGGTLGQFLQAVRNARKSKSLNVIVPAGGEDVPVPALTLTCVEITSALEAMQFAVARDGVPVLNVTRIDRNSGEPVYAIQLRTERENPPLGDPRMSTSVLSLNQITKPDWAPDGRSSIDAEVVLTAIESAIQTASKSNEPPTLKFHRESGLLIVRGNSNQLEVAKEVVRRLEDDIERHAADRLGHDETRAFPLAHIDTTAAVDTLRSAFPVDVEGKSPMKIAANAQTNSVVVNAPSSLQAAVAAVLRVVDRAAGPNADLDAARARLEAMQQEMMSIRKVAEDQMHQAIEARTAAAEADAVRAAMNARAEEYQARERQMRDQALKVEDVARELEAQKKQLEAERDALMQQIEALRKAAAPR